MDRLTKENPNWIDDEFWTAAEEPDDERITDVYLRLKAYEDTGLMPEEIEALQSELEQQRIKASANETKLINDVEKFKHLFHSERAELEQVKAERDKAVKCITDVETYMDLGSGKFAYKTIQRWRGMEGR